MKQERQIEIAGAIYRIFLLGKPEPEETERNENASRINPVSRGFVEGCKDTGIDGSNQEVQLILYQIADWYPSEKTLTEVLSKQKENVSPYEFRKFCFLFTGRTEPRGHTEKRQEEEADEPAAAKGGEK